jgi:SNF2 family DNA or RNA helicase
MTLPIYRQMMIRHLITHPRAALFAGLGMGKCFATIVAFDGLRLMGDAETMLVVAPLRVCNLTWPTELARWAPHLEVASLRTKAGWKAWHDRSADVYLCNYEMLPKLAKLLAHWCSDVVVFDELTRAKNPSSQRIKAIRQLIPKTARRWGLTGTPAPNSLMELFGQFRLLDNGDRLGQSFEAFKQGFFHATDYMEYNWVPNPGAEEKIQAKISDITLTLLSSEYLNLPDTVVEDLEVKLPTEARWMYDELEKELLLLIGKSGQVIVAPNAAVLVNKLLQVAGGSVYDEQGVPVLIHAAKFEAVKDYCEKHPEPLLIAYNYRHELAYLRQSLSGAEAFEDAKTATAQSELEQRWNRGEVARLLVHPQSVGHGLNLQEGGSTVLWFSPTWSRELYDQLNGRVARFGQKRVIRIVRVLCTGTIDDAVVETLRTKGDNQSALLDALVNLRKLHEA